MTDATPRFVLGALDPNGEAEAANLAPGDLGSSQSATVTRSRPLARLRATRSTPRCRPTSTPSN
jgi:hypothetical protein